MNKSESAQQFIARMNLESLRLQALAKAFDTAVEQFGVRELAMALRESQNATV